MTASSPSPQAPQCAPNPQGNPNPGDPQGNPQGTLPAALQRFCDVYASLEKETLDQLDTVYRDDIHFADPMHELQGLPALRRYFESLYTHLDYCRFEQLHAYASHDGDAQVGHVSWRMRFVHPRLGGGREVQVEGLSQLRFDEHQIYAHRDYLDLGQMLYEQLPVVGALIRLVKRRAVA